MKGTDHEERVAIRWLGAALGASGGPAAAYGALWSGIGDARSTASAFGMTMVVVLAGALLGALLGALTWGLFVDRRAQAMGAHLGARSASLPSPSPGASVRLCAREPSAEPRGSTPEPPGADPDEDHLGPARPATPYGFLGFSALFGGSVGMLAGALAGFPVGGIFGAAGGFVGGGVGALVWGRLAPVEARGARRAALLTTSVAMGAGYLLAYWMGS